MSCILHFRENKRNRLVFVECRTNEVFDSTHLFLQKQTLITIITDKPSYLQTCVYYIYIYKPVVTLRETSNKP